jgi:hypothetical protein
MPQPITTSSETQRVAIVTGPLIMRGESENRALTEF